MDIPEHRKLKNNLIKEDKKETERKETRKLDRRPIQKYESDSVMLS